MTSPAETLEKVVREFIRPAVRAVPSPMARRLGPCTVSLFTFANPDLSSRWTETPSGLEVELTSSGFEEHDVAMELLLCLGQVLWGRLLDYEVQAYWKLLDEEFGTGITGEIDERALEEKRRFLRGRTRSRAARYGFASFAGTAAEYVHCLWHEVTVRTGPEHLPAPQLQRRLELLARWFPPDRDYRLFPSANR